MEAPYLKHPCGRRCEAEKLSQLLLMRRESERSKISEMRCSSLAGLWICTILLMMRLGIVVVSWWCFARRCPKGRWLLNLGMAELEHAPHGISHAMPRPASTFTCLLYSIARSRFLALY